MPGSASLPEATMLDSFFERQRSSDLLRVCTAGSVDDGKSTLIGRLLFDTEGVYDDELAAIAGKGSVPGTHDLALLTDGLRAEREQGITIDVAYRFFASAHRRYILADTPGHVQYTRNMATGASTADAAIVLVDARKGALPQSRRHAAIVAQMGVRSVIVAVNKMDLVDYDAGVYGRIRDDFTRLFADMGDLRPHRVMFVPVNALAGENIVRRSAAMPWYEGPALLELLEGLAPEADRSERPFRMAVQRVIRTEDGFRGYAGQIASGTVAPGDDVLVLPSGQRTRVARIVAPQGDRAQATAPASVCLTFADEIDLARGDLLGSPVQPAQLTDRFLASLVWMHAERLVPGRRYLLKHGSRTVQAEIPRVLELVAGERPGSLGLNDLGLVEVRTSVPLALDRYLDNRATGSFILIERESAATVAAGMVRELELGESSVGEHLPGRVSAEERGLRWGHTGVLVRLTGPDLFAAAVERALFLRGVFVARLQSAQAAQTLVDAGALVLEHTPGGDATIAIDGRPAPVAGAREAMAWLEAEGALRAAGADI